MILKLADLQDESDAYLKDCYAKNRASNPAPKVRRESKYWVLN